MGIKERRELRNAVLTTSAKEIMRMRKLHNSLLRNLRYSITANNVVLEDKHKYLLIHKLTAFYS